MILTMSLLRTESSECPRTQHGEHRRARSTLEIHHFRHHGFDLVPAAYVGGPVHLKNNITLTGSIGYPTVAIGVSFML
jgi:hypothetical protein